MMTTKEAAEKLGVTPARIRQMIADKQLQATLQGRDWNITPGALGKIKRGTMGRPPKKKEAGS